MEVNSSTSSSSTTTTSSRKVTTTAAEESINTTTNSMDLQPLFSHHIEKGDKYRFYSLSTDCTGDNVAIGSEKNLFIANIFNATEEDNGGIHFRKVSSSKDIGCVVLTWCHYKSKANLIATSSSNNLMIWDIEGEKSTHSYQKAHLRNITSLSWNTKDTNLISSSSGDSFIKIWDTRVRQIPSNSIDTKSLLSQVSWNPHSETMLASSHPGEIKIWDIRKFGSPLTSWNTHVGSIRSIDWHFEQKSVILTSGSDNSIRIWDASPPNRLKKTYQTGHSCTKVKFLPFSKNNSVASFSNKALLNNISIWSGQSDQPVLNLSGHKNSIIDFDWRVKHYNGDNQYFLISISKDNHIRMWKFDNETINDIEKVATSVAMETRKTLFVPVDLAQELQLISMQKYENIVVEKSSFNERLCIINIENRKVIVIISLPSLYPSAPPCFEILTKDSATPITNALKMKLKREFDTLAIELMEGQSKSKKPFLYKLLEKYNENHINNIESFKEINSIIDSPTTIHKRTSKELRGLTSLRLSEEDNSILTSSISSTGSSGDETIQVQSTPPTTPDQSSRNIRGVSMNSVYPGSFAPLPPSTPYNLTTQSISFEMYQVKSTDTLTGISLQFSMPRDILIQTNRLFSEKLIPGTILWVYKKRREYESPTLNSDVSSIDSGQSSQNSPMPSPQIVTTTAPVGSNQTSSPSSESTTGRPRSRSHNSSTVNINNLFKPMKEEVEMAFKTLDPLNQQNQQLKLSPVRNPTDSAEKRMGWASRFAQIPKENVVKEELVCFTKDKKIQGTLTLTPYQLIFQSNEKIPTQIFTDYNQIISCKYFPNHTEWLAHLSKDWKKEQYLIKKKNQEKNDDYENFIQAEISKLNEMGGELTTMTINNQVKNVLVFPCIYLLIHKDNYIQTLFFRGPEGVSVHNCFISLKKTMSERKDSSPSLTGVSPLLGVSPPFGSPIPMMLQPTPSIPAKPQNLTCSFDSIDVSSQSPKLVNNRTTFNQKIILTPDLYKKLRHYLPMYVQGSDVELVYNSTNDGVSFNTFYRKMRNILQSILLVKDNGGYVFGAFISDEIKPKANFYGSGETFMFKLEPEFEVYKWTKENDLFIFTSFEYISIGGGSMFGLWMDTDFLNGYSGPCETFKNTCLSYKNDFHPVVVEFWAIK